MRTFADVHWLSKRQGTGVSKKMQAMCSAVVLSVAILSGVIASQLSAMPAHAYITSGYRQYNNWDITYQIGSATSYDRQGFINGLDAWAWADVPVGFYSTTGSSPNIYMYDVNDGNNSIVGYESDGLSTVVCRNGYDVIKTSYIYLNTYYTSQWQSDSNHIQNAAAHELGHALGLDDMNTGMELMLASGSYELYGIDSPQTDDINGVNYIYQYAC